MYRDYACFSAINKACNSEGSLYTQEEGNDGQIVARNKVLACIDLFKIVHGG